MDLFAAQRAFVQAQEVTDPGEDRAPHGGAGGRIQNELRQRHAIQPSGDRYEVADHREQPPDQCADLPVLSEKPLGAQQVLFAQKNVLAVALDERPPDELRDRKSTRLNSSHGYISYAVFCLKKKKN